MPLLNEENITVGSLGATRAVLHVLKLKLHDSINCLIITYTVERLIQFDVKTDYFFCTSL